jgi:hypothetical protein
VSQNVTTAIFIAMQTLRHDRGSTVSFQLEGGDGGATRSISISSTPLA